MEREPDNADLATWDSLPTTDGSGGSMRRVSRVVVAVAVGLTLIILMIAALVLVLQNTFRITA